MKIDLQEGKKIYFASDQHFGAPTPKESKVREAKFIRWLDEIKKDAQVLFLMGDLFDFWHEWQHVIPKGYVRLLGKLAELKDSGIELYFFVGNHDLWMKSYFEDELEVPVYFTKKYYEVSGKNFLLAHGDGLGPGDKGYKRMKKLFTNPVAQWFFKWLHPDISMRIALYLSQKNKMISGEEDKEFLGEDKEFLIIYAKEKLKTEKIDYFIFGHRHLPMVLDLNAGQSKYINLGDWIGYFTYGVFDGDHFELKTYEG
ncbi:UDP-2,3-diacylglucosamine hydrolase [Elizabethkingia miricola]|jgi:UDP-2,3-diacylglucosamine hydrolase|uniref:UDP-2,3-diacylglucosamine hydrolase n=2 Tax=Elizabethkingia TaxID=308865 RepID=A0AAJ3TPA8_9FLAO|nr:MULTISPECIES: UDP-2,3-diacylglucosamine diphosphatase [Elizabethkingia]MDR2229576.1 UDP-2,3-diacylglucosamine diphosphatase [Flavobacteriaceae bacterium]AQX09418.1 UDP-2,3-diacylglucosamine hydrolase [Elizabethkingia ursingii]KUY19726.1 UDP-2,3-diacylglucosamine hydrolase [Elizabethkingia miricola]KUY30126.1 UDP-2,3-diacylglucosamine hydrolase [Elizabethkingia ursingii]MCL1651364.1 UDP-2,3-diacylglucosamine diphosphatase [Elizabethkingia miricola]